MKLRTKQQNHVKTKHINYINLNSPQKYIKCKEFTNEEVSLLFNLRCKSVNSVKDNFHNMFGNNIQCDHCKLETDSQEHALQ